MGSVNRPRSKLEQRRRRGLAGRENVRLGRADLIRLSAGLSISPKLRCTGDRRDVGQ